MGQGLARAEAATSAAASCLLRRRRRTIGAIVVCGPSLGCPFDECGAHRARRRTCLPAGRFRHECGAKIWIWRPQAGHSKIPKDFWERVWQTRSPRHCERQAADVASQRLANAFQCSASGTQSHQHIFIIRTVSDLGSDVCSCEPRLQHQGLAGVLHQSPRNARSERSRDSTRSSGARPSAACGRAAATGSPRSRRPTS